MAFETEGCRVALKNDRHTTQDLAWLKVSLRRQALVLDVHADGASRLVHRSLEKTTKIETICTQEKTLILINTEPKFSSTGCHRNVYPMIEA